MAAQQLVQRDCRGCTRCTYCASIAAAALVAPKFTVSRSSRLQPGKAISKANRLSACLLQECVNQAAMMQRLVEHGV